MKKKEKKESKQRKEKITKKEKKVPDPKPTQTSPPCPRSEVK